MGAVLSATGVFTAEEVTVASELIGLGDDEAAANGYRFAVASDHGGAIGYACYGRAWFTDETWELYWIAVSPNLQRRGVGSRLLETVEAAASAERARMVLVETASKPSYEPARRFYESKGYTEVARVSDFYSQGDDKLIYRKSLRPNRAGPGTDTARAIRIAESPGRGRGVFASRSFAAGETIERAPVIVFAPEHWEHINRTTLEAFVFEWGEEGDDGAMCLGYASLYNHSFSPNASYARRYAEREIDFVAIRAIESGEEIVVNYNGNPDDQSPVSFETR
jgi:ribosomal protein S18 acetylase RimI-like enzyme